MRRVLEKRIWVLGAVSLVAGAAAYAGVFAIAAERGLDPSFLTGDSRAYALLAEHLLGHGVFSLAAQPPYHPDSFRAPGYPLFLAGLYAVAGSWPLALFLQVVLLASAPLLLYALVRPYDERAALWGALVFALEPLRLFYSASVLSDALFVCALLGSLLLFMRGIDRGSLGMLGAAGAVLGFGILVRPIAILLPVLFAGYAAWALPRKRLALVPLLAALIIVAPWAMRNQAHFGSYQLSSVGAYNLAVYNAPVYAAYRPSQEARAALEAFAARQASLPEHERTSLARAGEFAGVFRAVIAGRELDYALFHLVKTAPFFLTDGLRDVVRLFGTELAMPDLSGALLRGNGGAVVGYLAGGGAGVWLLLAGSLFWGLVCVGALACAWLAWRGRVARAWLFFAAVVLYFALLTGPVSNARYRLPVSGLLIAAAAVIVSRSLYATSRKPAMVV